MTEEKPLPGHSRESEASPANENTNEADGIAAALSALTSAATPVRDESPSQDAPAPENLSVSFSGTPATADAASQSAPPPPPAPEDTQAYPAPTGAPVAVNTAPTVSAVPPAPATKRKRWPWILAICIVAGVVLLGGIVACSSTMMKAAFHAVQHNERYYDHDDLYNHDMQDGLLNYYFGGMDATFDELLTHFNVEEGTITPDGSYARGGYRVGGDDGIAPGLYYLDGSLTGVSNYYVFHIDDEGDDPDYSFRMAGEYFGNYYAQLEEGDAVIFVPFASGESMYLAPSEPMDVLPPYRSGCYRVGIDIPAGTYTITCDADAARETDSEAGAYVMENLDFDEDTIVDSVFVIKGGRQTITVENGEYLELFAAIATPATASTKIPLQHVESELIHAA